LLGLTETWFVHDKEYCIPPNFEMVRSDRNSRAGGVGFLIRKGLKYRIIEVSKSEWSDPTSIESICINIELGSDKSISVCCVYRAKYLSEDLHNIEKLLHEFSLNVSRVILIGDFNVNILSAGVESNKLNDALSQHGFLQLINEPTREKNLLDLIIIKDVMSDYVKNVVVEEKYISDHKLVRCDIMIRSKEWKERKVSSRNFKSIDWE
jgi:hypothetical protein